MEPPHENSVSLCYTPITALRELGDRDRSFERKRSSSPSRSEYDYTAADRGLPARRQRTGTSGNGKSDYGSAVGSVSDVATEESIEFFDVASVEEGGGGRRRESSGSLSEEGGPGGAKMAESVRSSLRGELRDELVSPEGPRADSRRTALSEGFGGEISPSRLPPDPLDTQLYQIVDQSTVGWVWDVHLGWIPAT